MWRGGAPWRNGFRGCKGVGDVWELDRWMYSGKTSKAVELWIIIEGQGESVGEVVGGAIETDT